MYTRRLLVPTLVALAACGGDRAAGGADEAAAPTAPAIREIHFTATDFAFEGPAQIEAGTYTFALSNQGETLHHLQLVRDACAELAEASTLASCLRSGLDQLLRPAHGLPSVAC